MSKTIIGIYGASGFGKEIIPVVKSQLKNTESLRGCSLTFIDDNYKNNLFFNYPAVSYEDFLSNEASLKYVVIAIANSKIRQDLAEKCLKDGVKPWEVIADNALIPDNRLIAEGAVFCPFSMVTSDTKIGRHFHANIYSYVAHDCVIGDYVTFAPSVKCNGNIVVEDHAYIGTGAILKQGTPEKPLVIGRGAIVGMGAVVTKDVPPHTTVIGNPAKPIIKN